MPDYDFEVPRSRGVQQPNSCNATSQSSCAKDIIMHMLLARVATEGGETIELSTIFNPLVNALDIDVPEDILESIESIGIGPNLQRFMDWIGGIDAFDTIQLNPNLEENPAHSEGLLFYDNENKTLAVYSENENVTLQVGQELWILARNETGSAISGGDAVRIDSASGSFPTIELAKADLEGTAVAIGLATHVIPSNSVGFVIVYGRINDVDTSSWGAGDYLYVSPTTAGMLTNTKPSSPNVAMEMGRVLFSNAATGKILVKPRYDNFYTKNQIDNIINSIELNSSPIINELIVANIGTEGGDLFPTIGDAIDEINSFAGGPHEATALNPYIIRVTPGTFLEDPLTVPSWVTVRGDSRFVVLVTALDNNSPLFTLSANCSVEQLMCIGPTNEAAVFAQSANSSVNRLVFIGNLIALQADGVGNNILAEECQAYSGVTTFVYATDSGQIDCSNMLSYATNHFYANGGSLWIHNSGARGGTNGLYANNAGEIICSGVACFNTTNTVRANGVSVINGSSVQSRGTSTWDVLQEDVSHIDLSSSKFLSTKLSISEPANMHLSFDSELEGDESAIFLEKVQVGCPEIGRGTVMGEGSSYTRGMLVYTETAGNVFVDVSAEAASASGSTFTFPGVAQNNAIYVSSDLQDATDYKQFPGIRIATTTAAAMNGGEIVAEYWDNVVGGGSWVEFSHMSTLADAPHAQYADNIFVRANSSEQIRFDDLTDTTRFNWGKNDPPATGTNRFWIRFRISSAVTVAPIFEQFRVHTNRTKVDADGFVEHMGKARSTKSFESVNICNVMPVVGKSPGNNVVDFSPTIELAATGNRFANNASDGFGQVVPIPARLDTSLPLRYVVRWAPTSDSASADVALDLVLGQPQPGITLDGTNPETTMTEITTTVSNTANRIYVTEFVFSVQDSLPETGLLFVLQRQAAGGVGPTGDTYAGNIYIINIELKGYFWR